MGGRRDTGNYNVSVVVSMVMAKLESLKEYVRYEIEEDRLTHAELSKQLQQAYPGERGFSVRSIERLCRREGITKISQIDDRTLDEVISEAVMKVYRFRLSYMHFKGLNGRLLTWLLGHAV